MQRALHFSWMVIWALASTPARAVDGEYDPDWANGGRLTIDVSPDSDYAGSLLVQADGKLVLAGGCGDSLCVTRLLPSGSYDTSFGPSNHPGRVVFDPGASTGGPYHFVGAALTANGGVVLAADTVVAEAGVLGDLFVRLSADGGVDQAIVSAGSSGTIAYSMNAIATADDGKLIVASGEWVGTTQVIAVRRMLVNPLALDTSFGDPGGVKRIAIENFATPRAVAIQPDGKIIVLGYSAAHRLVLRLLPNGQLDDDPVLGFGDGGMALFDQSEVGSFTHVIVDHDGSLLIAGTIRSKVGPDQSYNFWVNRLTSRGQQHPGFGPCPPPICNFIPGPVRIDPRGLQHDDFPSALVLQEDGKILIGGVGFRGDSTSYFSLARLLPSGDLDPGFGSNGYIWGYYGAVSRDDRIEGIAVGIGGMTIAGAAQETTGTNYRFGIARLKLRTEVIFADGFQ